MENGSPRLGLLGESWTFPIGCEPFVGAVGAWA